MTINEQRLLDEILRRDFLSFSHRCVQTLNPGNPFLNNWHLQAMAHQLELVRAGELTRLIINLPPRYLKSVTSSVAFPAFLLGHQPHRRVICISYGMELAAKHASDFRTIVESPWYQRVFPQMRVTRIADSNIFTTAGGFRRTTSTGASITGLGGDVFIIDDPLKPIDALSDSRRTETNEWFWNTLISRLDNKATGAIILVMQRVHVDDLTGHLLERSRDWKHLSLPAIAEVDQEIPTGNGQLYLRRAGEALHPARESLQILNTLKDEIGPEIFSAQYQQSPIPPGGAMVKRASLRYYDELPKRDYGVKIIQSWDTAAKAATSNDFSVCTTWLVKDNSYYLLDVTRGCFEYPKLREVALALASRFKPTAILIEDASTGTALAQELRQLGSYVVNAIPVERDKITRLYVQTAKFEAGQVLFPKQAVWLEELERELLSFPYGKTDDQVDSITQALWYKKKVLDYAAFA